MSNEFYPDWMRISRELTAEMGSDDKVCDALSVEGVVADRSTIARLRSGDHQEPKYALGAALLKLHEDR